MKRSLQVLVGLCLVSGLLALAVAGCGSSSPATGSGGGSGSDSSTATASGSDSSTTTTDSESGLTPADTALATRQGREAGEQVAGGKPVALAPKTVSFLNFTSEAGAVRRSLAGIEAAAETIGWKFATCDAQGSTQQVAICASRLLQQNVDLVDEVAIAPSLVTPEMKEAKAKGVPWINSGGGMEPSPLFAGNIFYPEAKDTASVNKVFIEAVGEPAEIGTVEYAAISNTRERGEQLARELESHPGIEVVDSVEGSQTEIGAVTPAIVAMLQQHPNIKGIWSCCDIFNTPIVQAIHQLGLTGEKKPVVTGPFPDTSTLQAIREGDILAMNDLPWEAYGWIAVDEAAQFYAHGTPFTKFGPPTQYPEKLYASQVVTQENVVQDPEALQPPAYDYEAYFKAKWKAEFEGVE